MRFVLMLYCYYNLGESQKRQQHPKTVEPTCSVFISYTKAFLVESIFQAFNFLSFC